MKNSEIIKEIRACLNLSQSELAERLGVSFATVNRWERGRCEPSPIAVNAIKGLCVDNKIDYSRTAAALDDVYDRLQWAGEEYILEELNDEVNSLNKAGTVYPVEVMYWAGYTYRYWHYYTREDSREIYKTADAKTMKECWPGFHTFDVEMAIDDLKELCRQKREKGSVKEG